MADEIITGVSLNSELFPEIVQYGETIAAGDFVYEATDNKFWLADNTDPLRAKVGGIAMMPGAVDQYGPIHRFTGVMLTLVGPTLVVGAKYHLSATPGKMTLDALLATQELTTIGFGATVSQIQLSIVQTGIVIP